MPAAASILSFIIWFKYIERGINPRISSNFVRMFESTVIVIFVFIIPPIAIVSIELYISVRYSSTIKEWGAILGDMQKKLNWGYTVISIV